MNPVPYCESDLYGFVVQSSKGKESFKQWFISVASAAEIIVRFRRLGWFYDVDNLVPMSCKDNAGRFNWTDRPEWAAALKEKLAAEEGKA
jgi:hypothetical protein